ncbi:hypothetical protein PTSG_02172 [Salpingoeca rosetta]|uniref:PPM-type phosphatase domain-containing protein n=1 Tax=Salpingoeca rosetta (strain ATCC 50818 / BSB-021) TaxID=946362 RepID=F2U1F1_SALR5|nr:uncharacterized protein PTSG_02172 [Salpingoeca rosetta]EGD81453.1 hypothetical protein PTSG_02172 [Salpingoeca rosetta]|eukprot:XP_004996657.1 hypothetical protein PTSG_02172 [Salpingoeca rosetta]
MASSLLSRAVLRGTRRLVGAMAARRHVGPVGIRAPALSQAGFAWHSTARNDANNNNSSSGTNANNGDRANLATSTADATTETVTSLTDIGIFSDPGCKKGNEDRFVVGSVGPYSVIGVFDGHSGSMAADYVADNLLTLMRELLPTSTNNAESLLEALVHRLCSGLFEFMGAQYPLEKMHSGTTASIVLVNDSMVHFAHVGDSRLLLVRGGAPVQLTRDHRLEDDKERQRILDAGGRVTYTGIPRVDGRLAMTRAIGAFSLRDQGITCEPDIGSLPLDAAVDSALIVGTDGLFDELRNDEVVSIAAQHRTANGAAHALGEAALMYRARDNVTVAVVPLPAWSSLHNSASSSSSSSSTQPFGLDRNLVRRVS